MTKRLTVALLLSLSVTFAACGSQSTSTPSTGSGNNASGSGALTSQTADEISSNLEKVITKEQSKEMVKRCAQQENKVMCLRAQVNNIANVEDNVAVCDVLTVKDVCQDSYYFARAFRQKDVTLCAKIINKQDRAYCEKHVGAEPAQPEAKTDRPTEKK